MNSQRFVGKTIVITGAGSGIGQATSVAFADEGAQVVAIDLSAAGLDKTLGLISDRGGKAHALTLDVSDGAAVADAFSQIDARFGQIDLAFNNAGITQRECLTHETTLEEFQKLFRVNVDGVFLCLREELRRMKELGCGVIVNTASFCSQHTIPNLTTYTATKHAVLGITKNVAVEYGQFGIRVNCIAPGAIPTGMMAGTLSHLTPEQQDEAKAAMAQMHPLKRIGSTNEIADAVMFLCSEQAAFISGACLPVDGAWGAI
jgi:NAD(P)-dependent dehydrogenase (short-subunit alcohol dehydrogenase family)